MTWRPVALAHRGFNLAFWVVLGYYSGLAGAAVYATAPRDCRCCPRPPRLVPALRAAMAAWRTVRARPPACSHGRCAILVLLGSLQMQFVVRPYTFAFQNSLEVYLTWSSVLAIFLGLT